VAFKAGNKVAARQLLAEVAKAEPNNETAWLWLAGCVDNIEQKKFCLSKALAINPNNQNARKALMQLEPQELGQPSVEDIVANVSPLSPQSPRPEVSKAAIVPVSDSKTVVQPPRAAKKPVSLPLSNSQPSVTAGVRAGIGQSKLTEDAWKVLLLEVILISIGLGLWQESWWVCGGSFLGLLFLGGIAASNKPLAIFFAIGVGILWGLVGFGAGTLFDKSGGASLILGIIGLLAGIGIHFNALQYIQDLSRK
jgi:hypothetical protein